MSGGSNDKTTTVQQADPWKKQQPYLTDIFSQAKNLFYNQQPSYYPGTTVASFNPLETEGQSLALGAALGPQMDIAQGAAGSNQFLMSPDILRADANPYLADYARAATRPIWESLREEALPAITGGSIAAGQLGNSRQGIAEGQAIGRAAQAAGDVTKGIYSDAYGQGLEAMARGLALAPQTAGLATVPAATVAGVGAQNRAYEQALIDDAMQRYMFEQQAPWNALAGYQGLVQGTYGGTGTSSIDQNQSMGSQLAGAAGTGLATYGALSGLGGAAAAAAPWAAGAMALLSLF